MADDITLDGITAPIVATDGSCNTIVFDFGINAVQVPQVQPNIDPLAQAARLAIVPPDGIGTPLPFQPVVAVAQSPTQRLDGPAPGGKRYIVSIDNLPGPVGPNGLTTHMRWHVRAQSIADAWQQARIASGGMLSCDLPVRIREFNP